jgi:hypothetical protein
MTRQEGTNSLSKPAVRRSPIVRLACALLVGAASLGPAWGLGSAGSQKSAPVPCRTDVNFDDATDAHIAKDYKTATQQLLIQEKFEDLDCIMDSARSGKTRLTGGMWKLHLLYSGLESPRGHATEEDWAAHLARLNRWISAKPDSITPRVALAKSYMEYAWDARGTGFSDTVTESGWRLFEQRVAQAKEILEQASTLKNKCPEWYVVMQRIALAQGWDVAKAALLLDQAISFEPAYYYYYRMYEYFLQPRWNGGEGDSERFAEQAADRIGGTNGDILYFQLATYVVCECDTDPQLKLMSWPRIQSGFALLEKQNGTSLLNLNLLAYIAIKEKDAVSASELISRIGDNWDEDTWTSKEFFDSCKTWAASVVPGMGWINSLRAEADQNMRADEGRQLANSFQQKFASVIQECAQAAGGDPGTFELWVRIGKDGFIEQFNSERPKVNSCLSGKIYGPDHRLASPPRFPYWVRLEIEPATSGNMSSK